MSIQTYTKAFVNGNTGTAANMIFGEYSIKLAVRRQGNGRVKTSEVEFGMAGPAAGTVDELDEAAFLMAEKIAKLSDGVLMGFWKKMGKYRNDENPKLVHDLKKQYGLIFMSNDPRAADPMALGPYPLKPVTGKVFIPWLGNDVSRQDMIATLETPISSGAHSYSFALSRFLDTNKSAIEVFPLNHSAGATVKEYQRVAGFDLVNNDTAAGASDHTISEGFATIVDGDDDQGA